MSFVNQIAKTAPLCPKCGMEISGNEIKFCTECGEPLVKKSEEGARLNADECFCRSCGGIIKKEAEICVKCGVRQSGKVDANLDILQELKKYKEHKHMLCLECGYEGRVGVEGKVLSLWIRLPLYIVALLLCYLFFCVVSDWWWRIIIGFWLFYFCWVYLNKRYYICPKCKNRLKEK